MPRKSTRCPKCGCGIYNEIRLILLRDDLAMPTAHLECYYCGEQWVTASKIVIDYIRHKFFRG